MECDELHMETRTEQQDEASSGAPKLVFRTGPWRGKVLVLEKDKVSLGRDTTNDIALRDELISSRHAVVSRDDKGRFWIGDAGSKNGTYLNGERIQHAALKDGDVFSLCRTGPQIGFTCGLPTLPSALEASTGAFLRSRSIKAALQELLPQRPKSGLVTASGVRELVDRRLEDMTRRSRRTVALGALGLLLLVPLIAVLVRMPSGPEAAGVNHRLELELKLSPIYGSLFYSYRDDALGSVRVENLDEVALGGARLVFEIEKVIDPQNREVDFLVEQLELEIPELEPGGAWIGKIAPKLSTHVLSERNREVKAVARVMKEGQEVKATSCALLVYGHHVLSWEKPERVAAFIDPQDPAVQAFVKAVWPHRPQTAQREYPPRNVVDAVALVTALIDFELHYRPDPHTPVTADGAWKSHDRVNYPWETLLDGSGDCDDLTVLCCSILEAAGIPTAFVVAADHVLLLFDSGLDEEDLASAPFDRQTVIPWEGRIWLPLESTELDKPGATFRTVWAEAWRWCEFVPDEVVVVNISKFRERYAPLKPLAGEELEQQIREAEWVKAGLEGKIRKTIEDLKAMGLARLSETLAEATRGLEGLARQQVVAFHYSQAGLYGEAKIVLQRALFGQEAPSSPAAVVGWQDRLNEDQALLLHDLGITTLLDARSQEGRNMAAAYFELALAALPDDVPERGEMMLRLALIHRLRGDREEENRWKRRAIQRSPHLEDVYKRLITGTGNVAGESEVPLEFLKEGLLVRDKP